MRLNLPAVRCRLRRRSIHPADEFGRPIALDLAASLPHPHHRPLGKQAGQQAGEDIPLVYLSNEIA
jgi:hypothetical protein